MVEGAQVGPYRIIKRIGEGGMGQVWLAEHAMLGRRAAIKVLHHEFSTRSEIVARFFNEARAATAISDPGIVQIFDYGHHTDGSAYIVMELLEGEPLDQRLARVGAIAVPDALRIMRQVASTLGAAHARGIVHRDLKPENIFMVRDPEVVGGERAKVLDFGIAKLAGDHGGVKTKTSAVMGTPTYMSPEQCRGAGHVDQRSDVYALGCVLFRLLCGRPPFDAEGVGEIIVMHMREPPPAPSQLRPGIPPEIDQLVLRCLAKDPAQRFASGAELAVALSALTGSSPSLPAPSGVYAAASAPTTLSSAAGASSVSAPRSGSRGWLLAGAGTVVVAGVAIAIVTTRGDDRPATPAAETNAPAPEATTPEPVEKAPESAPPPADAPDATVEIVSRMKTVLGRFATWSREHAGAPCPDVATLGVEVNDPWGKPFRITCSDQPGDQMIGAISSGPDGAPGTGDDISSWSLGHEVTDLVRGPRWGVALATTAPATTSTKSTKKKASSTKTKSSAKPKSTGGVLLDENGLPISR